MYKKKNPLFLKCVKKCGREHCLKEEFRAMHPLFRELYRIQTIANYKFSEKIKYLNAMNYYVPIQQDEVCKIQ